MLLVKKIQLVHWQLLGNCISVTLASQGVPVGTFKGGETSKGISACEINVGCTFSASLQPLYLRKAVMREERTIGPFAVL